MNQQTVTKGKNLKLEGQRLTVRHAEPWWALFKPMLTGGLKWIPTYPDTRKGRSRRRLIRTALVVIGGLFALSARGIWPIVVGGILLVSSFLVPLTQTKKRQLLSRISGATKIKWRRQPVEVNVGASDIEICSPGQSGQQVASSIEEVSTDGGRHRIKTSNETIELRPDTATTTPETSEESNERVLIEVSSDQWRQIASQLSET